MEIRNRINQIIRSVNDFNLLRRQKQWSGREKDRERFRFDRLKMEYIHSRIDQGESFSEDSFNNLKIKG